MNMRLLLLASAAILSIQGVADGLDVRLTKGNGAEVVNARGDVLISFGGISLSYKKLYLFSPVEAWATTDGVRVEFAAPTNFPAEFAAPRVSADCTRRDGMVKTQWSITGVSTNDPFWAGGSMVLRRYPKGTARGGGYEKGGYWVRDPNGGIPWEEPLGSVVDYTNALGGVTCIYPPDLKANQSWQSPWQMHVPFVKVKDRPGEYESEFLIAAASESQGFEALALAAAGRTAAVSLSTPKAYNVFIGGEPLAFTARVLNATDASRDFKVAWIVRGFDGAVVSKGKKAVSLAGGAETSFPVTFNPGEERGLYFVEVRAVDAKTGKEAAFSRTNLARLPPYKFRDGPDRSVFGIAAYWPFPDDESMQNLLDRMGVMWVRGDSRPQRAPRRCIHHSSIWPASKLNTMTGEEREAWIEKELALCRERGAVGWEFLNEINGAIGGMGQMAHGVGRAILAPIYVEWLKDIVRIRKEKGYEDVKLLSVGLGGFDSNFMKRVKELGGWELLDGLCVHPGRGNFAPEYPYFRPEVFEGGSTPTDDPTKVEKMAHSSYWNFLGSVRDAEKMIKNYGKPMPLWLTEVYCCTYPNSAWEDTLRASAENTVLTYALIKADGVKCGMFYQMFDGIGFDKLGLKPDEREYSFGIFFRDMSPKPIFMGYVAIAEALDGAEFDCWLKTDCETTHAIRFRRGKGSVVVAWDRSEGLVLTKWPEKGEKFRSPEPWVNTWTKSVPFSLPAKGKVKVANAIGQLSELPVKDGKVTVQLTGEPKIFYIDGE